MCWRLNRQWFGTQCYSKSLPPHEQGINPCHVLHTQKTYKIWSNRLTTQLMFLLAEMVQFTATRFLLLKCNISNVSVWYKTKPKKILCFYLRWSQRFDLGWRCHINTFVDHFQRKDRNVIHVNTVGYSMTGLYHWAVVVRAPGTRCISLC